MKTLSILLSLLCLLSLPLSAAPPALKDMPTGGAFELKDADGPVRLSDFHGKTVLLYFGYTHCPDICPTSLYSIGQALAHLSPSQLKKVQALFITLDPERDSLERLPDYLGAFHPTIRGLSSDLAQIQQVAQKYGVVFDKVPLADSAMGYVVDHSAMIYLISGEGKLKFLLPHNTPAQIIREALLDDVQDD